MLTGRYQSIFILVTGAIYYLVDFWLMSRYDRLRSQAGTGRSWGYTALMITLLVILALQPVLLPQIGLEIKAPWGLALQGAGIGLVLAALAIHWWARTHLRQFYVEDVVHLVDHQLIDTGPYDYVRHPSFTSFMMIVAGLVLVNPSLPTGSVAAYVVWDFSRAARQEEALLSETLEGYEQYMRRTGRFLPRIWRQQ